MFGVVWKSYLHIVVQDRGLLLQLYEEKYEAW